MYCSDNCHLVLVTKSSDFQVSRRIIRFENYAFSSSSSKSNKIRIHSSGGCLPRNFTLRTTLFGFFFVLQTVQCQFSCAAGHFEMIANLGGVAENERKHDGNIKMCPERLFGVIH